MNQISPIDANKKMKSGDISIIDVRDQFEINASSIPNYIHIPMQEIPSRISEIPKDRPIAFLCHTGARSGRVTMFLMEHGFTNVVNISGGIERWSLEADSSIPRYRKSFGRAQII